MDSAENVWISDTGSGGLISKYGPYPSQNRVAEQSGGGQFGYGGIYIESLGINSTNGYLYVGDSGP
jgi:hypothetical protein